MFTITKQFEFSAHHRLDHLLNPNWPDDDPRQHQCSRHHGHNYVVVVELQAEELDANGFVVDYGALATFKHEIDTQLDHRSLNEVFRSSKATTAEALAQFLSRRATSLFPQVVAVRVSETPKTWAEYRPSPELFTAEAEATVETTIDWGISSEQVAKFARELVELVEKRYRGGK